MSGIEIKNISKRFGAVKALDQIDICFEEHKIYGLLGRNGAGKTTLLNIVNNRMYPDSGMVTLDGRDVAENDEVLRQFYFIGEKMLFPESLKGKHIFKWTQEFYPGFDMEYALELADLFELSLNKKMTALSTGYKSILKNVVALSVNTPYVFFDEPVLGLDAYHRDLFYKLLIEKYSEHPFGVIISTHLIEEISNIVEEVVIIKNGSIIKTESRDKLLSSGYAISGPASLVDSYIQDKEVIGKDTLGGLKTAYIIGSAKGCVIPDGLEVSAMDLQKLFIKLTNV